VSALVLALRALRYFVPFLVLSVIAYSPLLLWIVFRTSAPTDAAQAQSLLRLTWIVAALAWVPQFVLVGGVAPAVRALAAGAPLSQVGALGHGLVGFVRMLLPCLLVAVAAAVGSLALVVPGLALVVLLSLTGASTERGLPGPLLDSIAVVRSRLGLVTLVVVAIVVVDLAIAVAAQLIFAAPIPKKTVAKQLDAILATYQVVLYVIAGGLVIVSPVVASVLAAIRVSRR
jgi:hypothetical protein